MSFSQNVKRVPLVRNARRPKQGKLESGMVIWSAWLHSCVMGAVRVAAATAPHGANPINGDEDAERKHLGEKAHFAAGV
ncbi:hypothetical protein [uncultured Sphingobium sp.]|uniref:hypothetical protein n=1 Tax=uncultured Sphingobium sp. TaxID=316087 RepID=UPI002624FE3E|nr:hypothetical protein [uncultured Sphingobium sp.]